MNPHVKVALITPISWLAIKLVYAMPAESRLFRAGLWWTQRVEKPAVEAALERLENR